MKSMTGFGRAVAGEEPCRFEATVQGWNHRHADLAFRLPEGLRQEERGLRQLVLASIDRGRCEISIRREGSESTRPRRRLDRAAVEEFVRDVEPLVAAGLVSPTWALGELAQSPFFAVQEEPEADSVGDAEVAFAALGAALVAFDATRCEEGGRLESVVRAGLDELDSVVRRIREHRVGTVVELEASLKERLDLILPGGTDALPIERLAQEVVLLADRVDVREELDRLQGHIEAAGEILDKPGPHGRRMDFLVQELLRELNTIGSKSRDLETSQLVVEAKVINERIREQIQNVE